MGRISSGNYPNRSPNRSHHGLGLQNLIEIMETNATINDLDDQLRLLAGGLLLGLNLGRDNHAHGLDLGLSFRETDL